MRRRTALLLGLIGACGPGGRHGGVLTGTCDPGDKRECYSGVDGTESVAAFRILIRGDVTSATLVLTEESDTAMVAVSTP